MPGDATYELIGVSGSGPSDVWAVGYGCTAAGAVTTPGECVGARVGFSGGVVLHFDGCRWSSFIIPRSDRARFSMNTGVWASGPNDAWVAGSFGSDAESILHWVHGAWSFVVSPLGSLSAPVGVGGSGPNDVWFVGGGVYGAGYGPTEEILHWDGHMLSNSHFVSTASPLVAVWASGPDDAWAVGGDNIQRWDGDRWSGSLHPTIGSGGLNGVWGSGPSDVWAVGYEPYADGFTILHWNGSAWSTSPLPPMSADADGGAAFNVLYGVWGSAPGDVWAVGVDGSGSTILHWDGTAWSAAPTPPIPGGGALFGVWGSGPDDVWSVGSSGTIFHRR